MPDVGPGDDPTHALRIARVIGDTGEVVCVDIKQDALDKLKASLPHGVNNIQLVLGTPEDPMLPHARFDAVLISNTYHEMTEYKSMLDTFFEH